MKRKHLKQTAREAAVLAVALERRLPECCHVPWDDLIDAIWPLAVKLTKLERRARRDKKAAGEYRRLCADVTEELRTRPDSLVPAAVLGRTVAFDVEGWRVALERGTSADVLEAALWARARTVPGSGALVSVSRAWCGGCGPLPGSGGTASTSGWKTCSPLPDTDLRAGPARTSGTTDGSPKACEQEEAEEKGAQGGQEGRRHLPAVR